ncbi:MAG: tRNA pseudouridine(55) synthase TruB [Eubacterium sp.]|nr:tRNA pseudouridine(55) synthase TruB [Eubacterium sp.]
MYNGIVNVYKESGYTSHDVVAKLRGIYGQKKVGHTGTLDPMAEGVLIVLLGQATKLSDLILSSNKEYVATVRLGITSDTDDITGKIITSYESSSQISSKLNNITREDIESVLNSFLGSSMQIPPMYSAIKVNGKKLYEYARAGIEVKRDPRPVNIYSLELLDINMSEYEFKFRVSCSKGTYIRALIRDIGQLLGTGAVMSGLLRDEVNGIKAENAFKLNQLQSLKEEGRLLDAVSSIDTILKDVPAVGLKPTAIKLLENGNRLNYNNFKSLGLSDQECDIDISDSRLLNESEFFRVYADGRLRALYSYDKEKKDYKVFKML